MAASGPMAARDAGVSYDQLHHFIANGVWDAAPLEAALLAEADRQVGGNDAWLIVDDKENSVFAWLRSAPDGNPIAVISN